MRSQGVLSSGVCKATLSLILSPAATAASKPLPPLLPVSPCCQPTPNSYLAARKGAADKLCNPHAPLLSPSHTLHVPYQYHCVELPLSSVMLHFEHSPRAAIANFHHPSGPSPLCFLLLLPLIHPSPYLLMMASTTTWTGFWSVSRCTISNACLTMRTCTVHGGHACGAVGAGNHASSAGALNTQRVQKESCCGVGCHTGSDSMQVTGSAATRHNQLTCCAAPASRVRKPTADPLLQQWQH